MHIPHPGRAAGPAGEALCGVYATYGSDDHELIRRLARAAVREGQTDHYCPHCLRRLWPPTPLAVSR